MKIIQINTFYIHGSTGRIVSDLMHVMIDSGIDSYVAYGQNRSANKNVEFHKNVLKLQGQIRRKINILRTRLFDHHGFYNEYETKKLLSWIEQIHPDIIHLHNIHNHYVNIGYLFDYIKKRNIPVIWTLHDCWSFTGHCAYFDYANCNKWETGCMECPSIKDYPPTWFFDRTYSQYLEKMKLFSNVRNLTLVTPSCWLKELCSLSFLKYYNCIVINNGVDTSVFHPIQSDVREQYGIGQRKMILAVADGLAVRKGREYLLDLPNYLNDDEVLVLVGLGNGQEKLLPQTSKIIGIHRTKTADELVGLYSEADVFINPTLEDNFPTTNIEALACGTPVVTFKTGGSWECVDESTGMVANKGDIKDLLCKVRIVLDNGKDHYKEACVKKAQAMYNKDIQYRKYIELYHKILEK